MGEGGKFQSTHPSGVRPYHAGDECVDCRISINAPQWGATSNQLVGISFVFLISIHAPQWGATGRFGNHVEHRTDFNPRTPVGCDWVMVPPVVMLPRFQSTHPSGVRQSFHIPLWAAASFQSTHPSGVRRPTACNACTTAKYFNPRTPVGCDTGGPQARRPDADFNPRTPVGCDRSGLRGRGGFVEISIHAPQWGATTVDATITPILRFQSTHPSGVRPTATRTAIRVCNFNPRTPVGCDDPSRRSRRDQGYFNPRTPVGCDAREVAGAVHELISIHAPQWGATCRSFPRSRRQSISIHAPQWGATIFAHILPTLFRISIHAPQWGATWRGTRRPSFWDDFNPRTPVGCDAVCVITMATDLFQSTHPSGVRRGPNGRGLQRQRISIHAPQWGATRRRARTRATTSNFNPRTPVGCDLEMAAKRGDTEAISIHAPQWGATARLGQAGVHRPISIHAPQWGATTITSIGKSGAGDFNPRTPVGCDLHQLDVQLNIIKFQSTHPSGVRRVYYLQSHVTRHISIHAPQWGATES